MLARFPLGHIDTDLGEDSLGGQGIDAIDLGEVNTGHLVEIKTQVEIRLIAYGLVTLAFTIFEGLFSNIYLWLKFGVHNLDFKVTVLDFLRVEVKEFQCLLESEEVFGAVVAFEGQGDLLFGLAAAVVAVLGQSLGVVVA